MPLFLVLSLRCELCNTITKSKNAPSCNLTEPQLVECGPGWDRCATITATMDSPDEPPLQLKNCSMALFCDSPKYDVCEMVKVALNKSGIPLNTCRYDCCEESGCNSLKAAVVSVSESTTLEPSENHNVNPTEAEIFPHIVGSAHSAHACFGAIFFALLVAFTCHV